MHDAVEIGKFDEFSLNPEIDASDHVAEARRAQ